MIRIRCRSERRQGRGRRDDDDFETPHYSLSSRAWRGHRVSVSTLEKFWVKHHRLLLAN